MRLTIEIESDRLLLPIHYNYVIQSFIYRNISKKLAKFLHDEGYQTQGRRFKLFTFSRIIGKFSLRPKRGKIEFFGPVNFQIGSPLNNFIEEFANSIARKGMMILSNQRIGISSIKVHFTPKVKDSMKIEMLSPTTVYSTLRTMEGRKKTYYYSPFEDEFSRLVGKNLIKKYRALYRTEPDTSEVSIFPLWVNKNSQCIVKYRGTVIKSWMGRYRLNATPELILLAYDAGLGSKNSQGFGMFDIVE